LAAAGRVSFVKLPGVAALQVRSETDAEYGAIGISNEGIAQRLLLLHGKRQEDLSGSLRHSRPFL
jgi:hypothetical protein